MIDNRADCLICFVYMATLKKVFSNFVRNRLQIDFFVFAAVCAFAGRHSL